MKLFLLLLASCFYPRHKSIVPPQTFYYMMYSRIFDKFEFCADHFRQGYCNCVADLNVQIVGGREITKFCIHAVIADVQVLSAKKAKIDI